MKTRAGNTGVTVANRLVRIVMATVIAMIGLVAVPSAWPRAEAATVTGVEGSAGTIDGVFGTTLACARYNPSAGTFTAGEVQVGYGRSGAACPPNLDLSQQSGIGFAVNANPGTVADDTPFLLTTITQYNRPIAGISDGTNGPDPSSAYISGSLTVRLSGFEGQPTITYPWLLEETANVERLSDCPTWQRTATPCDDRVTFTDPAGTRSVVDDDGNRYRLTITNIQLAAGQTCAASPGAGTTTNQFITEERHNTVGCVYATLKPVRNVTIRKITSPAGTGDAFDFTVAGSGVDGSALPGFSLGHTQTTTQEIATSATYTETAVSRWNLTDLTCDRTEGVTTDLAARSVTIAPSGPDVTCTYTNTRTPWKDLVVTKTAEPAYDRDYDWTITKDVDRERAEVPAGETADFEYTVTATKSAAQDSNLRVTGVISIHNPNTDPMSGISVSDALPGGTCTVTDPNGVTVAAGATVTRAYSCTLADKPQGTITNTATATWSANAYPESSGTASGTAPVAFAGPTTVTDDTVTVTDDQFDLSGLPGGNVISETTTFTYSRSLGGAAGTCTDHDNTATLSTDDDADETADQTVTVCVGSDLVVSKNVVHSFDRSYAYDIAKDADATTRTVDPATGEATFDYEVTVSSLPFTDSRWQMSGRITVRNPNDWQDVTATVTDAVDIGGGAECTVAGGQDAVIARDDTRTFDYVCTFTGKPEYEGTNTATATWDAERFATPGGSASGTAEVAESGWSTTPINPTVQVVDDQTDPENPVVLGTYTWGMVGNSQTYRYSLSLDAPAGECVEHVNVARVTSLTGALVADPADKTVTVCHPAWTLSKTATPVSGSTVQPGDTVTYEVVATNTGASAVADVEIRDDLTDVLTHATFDDGSITWSASGDDSELGATPTRSGTTLSGTITSLAVGESVTLRYAVTLDEDAYRVTVRNAVTGGGDFPPATCTEEEPCATEHETPGRPRLTLEKVVENTHGGTAEATAWTLSADGPTPISGAHGDEDVTSAVVDGGAYRIAESGGPAGYEPVALQCVADGHVMAGVDLADPEVEVAAGEDVTCTFTNRDVPGTLTLVKQVENSWNGPLDVADFELTAEGPTEGVTGATGDDAVSGRTVEAGAYELSESTPDPIGYEQSGAWVCTGAELDGSTVTVANGADVTCTVTNVDKPARLTLVKVVDQAASGSTSEPVDWTLNAEPQQIAGQATVSGPGEPTADGGVDGREVSAGDYRLSEDGPDGFDAGAWVCEGAAVDGDVVSITNGANVTCTITNTAVAPKLTLVKVVDNGDTGGESTPADWVLVADGPSPIRGLTGEEAVTDVNVTVGDYDLGEIGDLDAYTASDWSCDDGILDGDVLTLDEGDDATCTITNTARPAVWSYDKTSDPAPGAVVEPGDVVTYTVTARHEGGVAATDVVLTDDLADVIDDGTLLDGSVVASAGTAQVVDGRLVWSIGSLESTQTLTYQVEVDSDAYGASLRNVVTGTGHTPAQECEDDCETDHPTPSAWTVSKSSDPVTGTVVDPGSTITYTLTVRNLTPDGEVPLEDLEVVDDLSGVVAHATLDRDSITASNGTATVTGTTLTWHVDELAERETVTYRVRVDDDAYGVTVRNVVSADGAQPCVPEVPAAQVVRGALAAAVAADTSCLSTEHGTPDPEGDTPSVQKSADVHLAATGARVGPFVVLGATLLMGSGFAVVARSRRRRDDAA